MTYPFHLTWYLPTIKFMITTIAFVSYPQLKNTYINTMTIAKVFVFYFRRSDFSTQEVHI